METWVHTEKATVDRAKGLMWHETGPIWVRWYRTYDNPHGGGPFGKSKEYCTCELVGVTEKRLRLKDHDGVHTVNPNTCYFAIRLRECNSTVNSPPPDVQTPGSKAE